MLKIRVEVLKLTNLHLGGSNRVFLLFSGSQQFQFFLVGHSSFLLVPSIQSIHLHIASFVEGAIVNYQCSIKPRQHVWPKKVALRVDLFSGTFVVPICCTDILYVNVCARLIWILTHIFLHVNVRTSIHTIDLNSNHVHHSDTYIPVCCTDICM
mgnify:CR=1 FL=1